MSSKGIVSECSEIHLQSTINRLPIIQATLMFYMLLAAVKRLGFY